MAWHIVSKLKQLILTMNNTDIELNNFDSCLPFNTEANIILSNPIPNMGQSESYSYSDRDNPSQYAAAYSSLVPGSLNFFAYYQIMNIGESFYIWRQSIGRNVRMTFTKSDAKFLCTVTWYNYTSPSIDIPTERQQYPNIDVVFSSIGFLIDNDNGVGSFYAINAWNDTQYTSRYQLVRRGYTWGWSGGSYDCARGIFALLFGNEPEPGPTPGGGNPYEGGGLNDEPAGGEDQNFEETSDTIVEPTLPSSPATGSGFITAYVPTLSEINDVADYLIDPSVLQALAGTVLKLSDVIIGLSIFPFTIAATGSKEIKMNLCGVHLTTGVTCHYSDSQFVTLNMGTLEVKKYWDNCLDYDPYTRITLYLPFVGFVDLDTDEVMGRNITIKYNVDIVTGCCLALIIVDGSVLYQYPGECSCQIPITSVSFDTFLQSAVQLGITAASGARAVKGAGGSLAEAGGHVLATDDAGVQRLAMADYDKERAKFTGIKASVTDSLISASVGAVLSAKGQYSHAGAMSSCAGILGTQKPFLIIKRPRQCMPEGFEGIRGFPCNMKATLSELEGYTEVGDIHLNIPNATVQEIVECEQFLKEGVFL